MYTSPLHYSPLPLHFSPLPLFCVLFCCCPVLQQYAHSKDQLDPHLFDVARRAFTGMQADHENQSVMISGESGAGKTEATKVILQYLSEVAGSSEKIEQVGDE